MLDCKRPRTSTQRAFVDRYCAACHNQRAKTAGLNSARLLTLDGLDLSHASEHPEAAETIVRKLRAGMMPPAGAPRPDAAALESFIASLETDLDRITPSVLTSIFCAMI